MAEFRTTSLKPRLKLQTEQLPLCAGSGVLVEVYGVSGILTAEHVIFNPKNPFESGQALWTIPRFYSMDRIDDPIVDGPTTHPSATNIHGSTGSCGCVVER